MEKKGIQELFEKWLSERLTQRSVRSYSATVPSNKEVQEIIRKYTGQDDLYRVTNIDTLEKIYEEVKRLDVNVRGKNMYSSAIRNYIDFLKKLLGDKSINPNIIADKIVCCTSCTPEEDVSEPECYVIVDYIAPYETVFWKGAIHLEINLKSKTLVSDGWSRENTPLSDYEAKKYLEFFTNIKNLIDFFDPRMAYNTPLDTRFPPHTKFYTLKIKWGAKEKEVSVGYPDIPFKHPFDKYCIVGVK